MSFCWFCHALAHLTFITQYSADDISTICFLIFLRKKKALTFHANNLHALLNPIFLGKLNTTITKLSSAQVAHILVRRAKG